MNTFSRLMHCDGCTDRLTYQRNVALLAFGKATVDLLTLAFIPGTSAMQVAAAWLNPFNLIAPWLAGDMPTMICLSTFLFFSALVWNSVHRARHAGWSHWMGLLTAVPFVGAVMTVVLALAPARKHTVWDLI
ncbi:MAG: hypothetical protein KF797_05940 [Flavobacteriales bacterium]|nr:hypothetical protein [Flavobacteriales bacterium]